MLLIMIITITLCVLAAQRKTLVFFELSNSQIVSLELGFPMGRDFLGPWDKGTEVPYCPGTTEQAQNLATEQAGTGF